MSQEQRIRDLVEAVASQFNLMQARILELEAMIPIPTFARLASTAATRHIHSGHSLTDSYFAGGDWPGTMQLMTQAQFPDVTFANDPNDRHYKSTMPGSATWWRWQYYNTVDLNPRDNMDQFDALVITERGLDNIGVADESTEVLLEDIFYEMRFALRTWQQGRKTERPTEFILWSIWPAINWANTGAILRDYERRFKFRADYITWKMRQLYPDLPANWRVWICPGSLYIERLHADVLAGIVPGIAPASTGLPLRVLYGDGSGEDYIHLSLAACYGASCMMQTMLYQRDLRTIPNMMRPAYITAQQAEYFQRIAWEICRSYEPAGMGGTQGAAPAWTLAQHGDMYSTLTTPAQWETAEHTVGVMPGAPAPNSPVVTTAASISGSTSPIGTLTLSIGAASGNPAPAATQQWFKDGAAISGATGLTLDKSVHGVGSYTAVVTWSNGIAPNATSTSNAIAVVQGGSTGAIPADRLMRWSATGGYQGPSILNGQTPFAPTGDFIRFGGRTGETAGPDQPGFVLDMPTTGGIYLAMRARINQIQPRQGDSLDVLNLRNGADNGIVRPYRIGLDSWHMYPTMVRTVYDPTGNWQDETVINDTNPAGRDSFGTIEAWIIGNQMGVRTNGGSLTVETMPVSVPAYSHVVFMRTYIWLTIDIKDIVLMGRMPSEAEAADIRAAFPA